MFFTCRNVFCDLLQYTRTEKYNLFVLYNKNSNGLLKDLGYEKRKTNPLMWIWRHLCVCPLIDHGQQPIKIHTEVTLLYTYTFKKIKLKHYMYFIHYVGQHLDYPNHMYINFYINLLTLHWSKASAQNVCNLLYHFNSLLL